MLMQPDFQHIIQAITSKYRPEKIILFGSYASGTATDTSDLDLLIVVKNSSQPRHQRAREVRKLLWGMLDIPKDILVYTQDEIDEWQNVAEAFITTVVNTGKVLYEDKSRTYSKLVKQS